MDWPFAVAVVLTTAALGVAAVIWAQVLRPEAPGGTPTAAPARVTNSGGTAEPATVPPIATGTGIVAAASPSPAATASPPVASPQAAGRPPASPVASTGSPTVVPSPAVREDPRVEQALAALRTDADRVGQLLLLGWEGSSAEQAREMLRELRPGGVVFIGNARTRAAANEINAGLVALGQQYGLVRPLLAIDHEGGPVQRIEDVPNLGSNFEFAARGRSEREACERGRTHAAQLRGMGFSMNLAPVLDANTNPENPVIGVRSYGADPRLVASLGSAYARGLQGGGVAAVGKHFPGHGDTAVDSHLGLPVLLKSPGQLEQVELIPFRRAIAPPTDITAIMSAHIALPALDPSRVPATLSRPILTGLLREQMGYGGLAVSDDLGAMRAITDNFGPGDAAVRAVRAGIDLLIIGGDFTRQRASRDALVAALGTGELSRDRVDEAVRRVLRVKARFGLLGGPAVADGGCS